MALKNDSLVGRDTSQGNHTKTQQSTSRNLEIIGTLKLMRTPLISAIAYGIIIAHQVGSPAESRRPDVTC